MTPPDWSDVRERLARLAAAPGAAKVFGSLGHGWRLEPPLTADELVEVETQLQVQLPDEYRSFLREAGRGGAGPAYGLFPLRRLDGTWQWEGDGATLTDRGTLHRPFGHVEAFNPADGLPEPPVESDFEFSKQFLAAEEEYWELHDRVVFGPEHTIGLLYLCHIGCALREALVVNGPAGGQMWADDTAEDGGFRPLRDHAGARVGFAGWYRGWLDEAEALAF